MSEQPYFTIYGEDWNYESNTNGTWVDRESFDTLAQRLQEAERLRDRMSSLLRSIRRHNSSGLTRDTQEEIDAFLAGKGDKA